MSSIINNPAQTASARPNHPAPAPPPHEHPLLQLPPEDLDLITELVLQSGSLKGLAKVYGVSYPTIRNRLDRTIARLKHAVEGRTPDPLTNLLASLVERNELSAAGARAVRDLVRNNNAKGEKE